MADFYKPDQIDHKANAYRVLSSGGEMGKLILSMDWSQTSLGSIEVWPQSLLTTVSLCLASNFPISMAWGKGHVQIYNDGYKPICGAHHPLYMGQDFRVCWASSWPDIGEAYERAWQGESSFIENMRTFVTRNGYLEEAFFTFSFSPIRDETGGVGGIFHPVTEKTAEMLSERRTRALRDLAANTGEAKCIEEVFKLAAKTLQEYNLDLPFVLFYRLSGKGTHAHLVASSGIARGTSASPEEIDLTSSEWEPLAELLKSGKGTKVIDLQAKFGAIKSGPYPESPKTALLLPISTPGTERTTAVLIAGLSPRLALTEVYLDFCSMLAANINAAVANAAAYEEERKRADALAQIDRAKTAFFSNVSHEFRTPLTLMLAPLEDALAKGDAHVSPESRELLLIARRNTLRLQKLVNSLLDFSRIEAGRIQASFRPTDLAGLTAELASNFRSAVEKAGLQLIVDCPPLSEPFYVDRDSWEKIVLNLLSNAFKHTFEGTISVSMRSLPERAELVVQDTGVGIAADQLPHLFERFHRVPNARSRTHEGTGIGLALVHELVKIHGGSISVESTENQGTTFIVSIPAGKEHLPADRIEAETTLSTTALGVQPYIEESLSWMLEKGGEYRMVSSPSPQAETWAGTTPGDSSTARIILADDNADMLEYMRRLLAPHCEVIAVTNGKEALEAALRNPPDLILSDVMMPQMDGFELLSAVRSNPVIRAIPVFLLSARAGEEARVEGLKAGADDYLIKPFSARELLARVKAQLNLQRVRREAAHSLEKSFERERLIAEIVEGIRSETDLNTVLQKTVNSLGKFTNADRCTIWLYDSNQKSFQIPKNEYRSSSQIPSVADTAYPFNPVLPFKLNHHEVINIPDILESEGLSREDIQMITERGIKSLMHVPILHEDKLLGVLRVHTVYEKQNWGAETISIVKQVADQVASAIHKAALMLELRQSDALKTAILESSLDAIVGMDHRGIVTGWNAAAERMFGYSRAEAIGRKMGDLIIPERYRAAHHQGLAHYLRTGEGKVINNLIEIPALRADGTEFLSELTIATLQTDGPPLFTGTLRDITKRKLQEHALQESEQRFRNLANSLPIVVWMASPDGNLTFISNQWEEHYGNSIQESLGSGWAKFVHPDDIDRAIAVWNHSLLTGENYETEFRSIHKSGKYRWILVRAVPIRDQAGNIISWYGSNTDIQDKKHDEESLIIKNQQLTAINNDLDNFIYTASHDLKAPITNIDGLVHMLVRHLPANTLENPTVDKVIALIRDSISRFKSTIKDLTEVSKLQRSIEDDATKVSLPEVFEEIRLDLQSAIEESGARLEVDFSECPVLHYSKKNLRSIVYNLVSNAIKYHSPEREPVVRVHTKADGGTCVLTVEDNGLGIDLSQENKMFSMFKRLHDHVEGSGVGLYIVKKIVENSGGKIEVKSVVGKGSTFTVYFTC